MGYTPPRDLWQHVYDDAGQTLRVYDVSGTAATINAVAGSQYLEQSTSATIVGTVAMGETSDKLLPLQLTAGSLLRVSIDGDTVGIGGGIQYGENVSVAFPTGTVLLWRGTGNSAAVVSTNSPLPVSDSVSQSSLSTISSNSTQITANTLHLEKTIGTDNSTPPSRHISIGAVVDNSSVGLPTGDDRAYSLRMSNYRGLHVNLRDSSGGELGQTGLPLIVGVGSPLPPGTNLLGSVVVSDGGNSVTVDGSVTAVQSSHDNFNANANIQVGNVDVSVSNKVPVSGNVSINGTTVVDLANVGGTSFQLGQDIMTSSLPVVIASDQSIVSTRPSGTLLQVYVPSGIVSAKLQDGVGTNITSDSYNGEQAIYTAGGFSSRSGIVLTGINALYNNSTTSARSQTISTAGFNRADFVAMVSSSGAPTDITFYMEAVDGGNFYNMRNGFLGKFIFDDTAVAGSKFIHVTFPCPLTDNMSVAVSGVGTTSFLTFTVSGAKLIFGT